jgi:hypothetical protein
VKGFDIRAAAIHYLRHDLGGRKYINIIDNPDIDDETEEEIIQECMELLTRAILAERERCMEAIATWGLTNQSVEPNAQYIATKIAYAIQEEPT